MSGVQRGSLLGIVIVAVELIYESLFLATVRKTVRPVLSDRCPVCMSVCPVYLSVTLMYCYYCGQTVGRIKIKLGMQIDFAVATLC